MHGSQPAAVHRPCLLRHLIVQVTRRHDRLRLIAPSTRRVQASCDSFLAVADDLGIGSAHSKCSSFFGWLVVANSPNQDWTGISSFFLYLTRRSHAFLRTS